MEFFMHGLILLVVFVLVFLNIVRAIMKEARKTAEGSGNKTPSNGNLLNVLSSRARNEAWMEAAGAMKMEYIRPATLRARPSVRGMVKDFVTEAHMEYSASGSLATVCSVQFPEKLGIGLLIMRDQPAVVAEEFADRNSLRVMALEGLDVRCSAKNADALKSFLTPMRINAIKNALSFYRSVKITDDYVVLKLGGECRETDFLTNLIEFTVSLASILYKETRSGIEPRRGFQEFAGKEENLPGLKTVVEPSPASDVPEFRQPKTILTPIRPVTDDAELLESDDGASSPASDAADDNRTAAAPSRCPEMKSVAPPAFARSKMPEVKPAVSSVKPAASVSVSSPCLGGEKTPAEQEASVPSLSTSSGSLLDQDTLAAALFSSSFPGQKEQELFNRVKGQKIEWTGALKSSYQFGNDFVLGSGPAVKAVFEIAEISGNYSMKTKVKAVVRLPLDSLEALKNRNGEQFHFSGILAKLETYAREIVIIDGALN